MEEDKYPIESLRIDTPERFQGESHLENIIIVEGVKVRLTPGKEDDVQWYRIPKILEEDSVPLRTILEDCAGQYTEGPVDELRMALNEMMINKEEYEEGETQLIRVHTQSAGSTYLKKIIESPEEKAKQKHDLIVVYFPDGHAYCPNGKIREIGEKSGLQKRGWGESLISFLSFCYFKEGGGERQYIAKLVERKE